MTQDQPSPPTSDRSAQPAAPDADQTVAQDSASTSSQNSIRFWMIALGLVSAIIVGAALWVAKGTRSVNSPLAGSAAPSNGEIPNRNALENEAQRRAAWDAQMQQVNRVLSQLDREQLIGSSATKGPQDAEIILIKFSDFQCPYCALASADMKTFTQAHTEDVLYVYKHLPLVSIHEEALPAAKAAWAAGQQDRFWLYHDGLFAYQNRLGEAYYVELAEAMGLDVAQFNRDRNSLEAEAAIAQDVELAKALGVRATPSFLINDLLIPGGAPLELFEEAVIRLKAAAPTAPQSATR